MKSLEELRVIRERMSTASTALMCWYAEEQDVHHPAARRSENVWMKRFGRTDWKRKYV